jgi:hypothetical protein
MQITLFDRVLTPNSLGGISALFFSVQYHLDALFVLELLNF